MSAEVSNLLDLLRLLYFFPSCMIMFLEFGFICLIFYLFGLSSMLSLLPPPPFPSQAGLIGLLFLSMFALLFGRLHGGGGETMPLIGSKRCSPEAFIPRFAWCAIAVVSLWTTYWSIARRPPSFWVDFYRWYALVGQYPTLIQEWAWDLNASHVHKKVKRI